MGATLSRRRQYDDAQNPASAVPQQCRQGVLRYYIVVCHKQKGREVAQGERREKEKSTSDMMSKRYRKQSRISLSSCVRNDDRSHLFCLSSTSAKSRRSRGGCDDGGPLRLVNRRMDLFLVAISESKATTTVKDDVGLVTCTMRKPRAMIFSSEATRKTR